jgi:hypothetical protein
LVWGHASTLAPGPTSHPRPAANEIKKSRPAACLPAANKIKNQLDLCNVGMETDPIRMESDWDVTFYHILIRIRIRMQIFLNTNTKQMFPDSDFYLDIYSIQLKEHIVKFNMDEYNFTTKFVHNQCE